MRRLRTAALLQATALTAVVALALSVALPTADAQTALDTLVFETVGDRPIDADDLAFDTADTLWASAAEVLRLAPGDTATWRELNPHAYRYILPLGADTLLLGGAGAVYRSLDGGRTFYDIHDEGERLFAAASGRLVAGTRAETGVIYSADRGATWAEGMVEGGTGTWQPWAEAFAEVPAGHPRAGRLVAAGWAGLSYSDDGGATWQRSNVWDTYGGRYFGHDLAAAASDERVWAAFDEGGVFGTQIGVSADGGASYERRTSLFDGGGFGLRLMWLAGGPNPEVGVLVVVENRGQVHVSTDGAVSWRQVGQVPFTSPSNSMRDALVGPDGRLYVAGGRIGPEREWVFRSTAPMVAPAGVSVGIAPESPPVVIPPEGGGVPFVLTLANTTDEEQRFDAWAEATLPDGSVVGPEGGVVLGPVAVVLGPGQTLTRRLVQRVPAGAPSGGYTYTALVGTYPDGPVASDRFTGVKEPDAGVAGGRAVAGWSVADAVTGAAVARGDEWRAAGTDAADLPEALGLSVAPNPFRAEARVTLTLSAPGAATVGVYDVLGRRVAVLTAGPLGAGSHVFRLDGAALPAGVYVVRA